MKKLNMAILVPSGFGVNGSQLYVGSEGCITYFTYFWPSAMMDNPILHHVWKK